MRFVASREISVRSPTSSSTFNRFGITVSTFSVLL
jgi:hypothetical protein